MFTLKIAPTFFLIVTASNIFSLHLPKSALNKREAFCPQEIFSCSRPLDYSFTQQFICSGSQMCPSGYACCPDSCFQHQICKKIGVVPEYCPSEDFSCAAPLDFEATKQFLCHSDDNCPQGYICCQDSCFLHNICKKSFSNVDEIGTTPFTVLTSEEFDTQPTTLVEDGYTVTSTGYYDSETTEASESIENESNGNNYEGNSQTDNNIETIESTPASTKFNTTEAPKEDNDHKEEDNTNKDDEVEDNGNEDNGNEDNGNEGNGDEGNGDEDNGDEGNGDEDNGDEDNGYEDNGDEGNGDEDNGDEDNGDEDNGDEDNGNEDNDNGNEGDSANDRNGNVFNLFTT